MKKLFIENTYPLKKEIIVQELLIQHSMFSLKYLYFGNGLIELVLKACVTKMMLNSRFFHNK